MNVKLVAFLIAVTAAFLIACSPETGPSPARITGTDSSTASTTATTTATASPTAETPPVVEQVATAPAEPQSEPTAAPEPTTPTSAPTTTPTDIAEPKPAALQVTIAPAPVNLPQYDRAQWKHWTDHDRDCQNARHEVLVAESLITPTFRTDKDCIVEAGQWLAPYSAITVTDPGDLDIDHMVPLRNAHNSAAWEWTAERKRLYANYLDDPQHLIAVTARANRSKGARGPEDWKPDDRTYWCQYATDWITVKSTWELTVTRNEHRALTAMLTTWQDPPSLSVSTQQGSRVGPRATSTPAPQSQPGNTTYSTCNAAIAAGEPRIQGTQGRGRGFPAWMAPSTRDGDGDGVVCEK